MKSFCVFLIPRQVQALFLLLCSCHMLLLFNLAKAPITSSNTPETGALSTAKAESIAVKSIRSSQHSPASDYKLSSGELRSHHLHNRKSHLEAMQQSALLSRDDSASAQVLSKRVKQYNKSSVVSNGLNEHNGSFIKQQDSQNNSWNLTDKYYTDSKIPDSITSNEIRKLTSESQYVITKPHNSGNRNSQDSHAVTHFKFPYLINQPEMCSQNEEEMNYTVHSIIVALSHPYNKAQRDAIRNTWARHIQYSESPIQLRLVFVLGNSDLVYSSTEQLDRVRKEAKLYKDIIMGDFNDTYKNLTIKSLFALQWVTEYCNNTQYTIKTDDDTFVNTDSLREFLARGKNDSIMGALNANADVMRTGLWGVPMDQYPQSTYPSYCTGCIYVLSTHIVPLLLNSAKSIRAISIEDAFITGILAQDNGLVCSNQDNFPQWFMSFNKENNCKLLTKKLVALHNIPYEIMYKLNDIIQHRNILHNCHQYELSLNKS